MRICLQCRRTLEIDGWKCPHCGWQPDSQNGLLVFSPEFSADSADYPHAVFQILAELEGKHFWFRSRSLLLMWALDHYFPHAETFLEVGCGTGFVLSGMRSAFPSMRLVGGDVATDGLLVAKQRNPDVPLFQMDARSIPFQEEFDVVGAFDLLEHVEDDEQVVSEIFRAVASGGGLIVSVPQHQFLWSHVDEMAFHKRRYSKDELVRKIEKAGFRIKRVTSFVSLLMPLLFVSRILRPNKRQHNDPISELKLGDFSNFFGALVMGLERSAIKRGFSFPFGGSLFLVAGKPTTSNS